MPGRVKFQEGVHQENEAAKAIIEEFKSAPLDFSNPKTMASLPFSDTYFFHSVKGVHMALFQPERAHFGVDVMTRQDEHFSYIFDGTVIFTAWTLETGLIIVIQYFHELISIYKDISVGLKYNQNTEIFQEISLIPRFTGEF